MTVPAAVPGAAATPGAAPPPPAAAPPADQLVPDAGPAPVEGAADGAGAGAPGAEADAAPEAGRVGDGAAEATRSFGHGALRHDSVHSALANVDGDVVGGDKYVFLLSGRQERLRLLSPLLLERAQHAFEEPPGWAALRAEFGRRRITVLRGPAGTGKTTAAIRLLLGAGRTIYRLDPETALDSLAQRLENRSEGGIETGAGLLLDQPADVTALRGWMLEGLAGALERADARLVLTVDQQAGLIDTELLDHIVELAAPADHLGIVARYLRWRLGDPAAARLLADERVRPVLAEQFTADPSCRLAAEVAAAIVEQVEAGGEPVPDPDRIRDRLLRRDEGDFEIWAEGLDDPGLRSHAIALAVLGGLPHEDIASAARSLHRRLVRTDYAVLVAADGTVPRVPDPFGGLRRRRLARLRAHAERVELFSPAGPVPAEGLRYKDPSYPVKVIRHAWTELQIHQVLLDWLGELVLDPSEQVRIYAGVALGVIAEDSFHYLAARVFTRWAGSTDRRLRSAVAYALSVCAKNPALRGQVTGLAAGWLAAEAEPLRQACAARVYGISLGPVEPLAAIDALIRLSVVDHSQVAIAIGDSVTDVLSDDESLTWLVLVRLATGLDEQPARPTVLLAFLIVAAQLVVETAGRVTDAAVPNWPALLYGADREERLREPFVRLWRAALNEPVYRHEAEGVLKIWAGLAEGDPALRERFLRMVAAVATGDPRSAAVLRRHAAGWVAPDALTALKRTAADVVALLDREKVLR
ncbi:ATP-binding protein [Kitasatospora sp. RB6PN24]|uniref:ATP-binding protein n=1 Tax=Kitasatospora humi TaxID=2893891 RepID=UPI001E48061D|nr:ATP-binding protein [Kitasatospora humi]MCC9310934.1 ATP-binding protein [Kitasatospora humi]